jgi:predicted MFS family arabinose efflux permease
MQGVLFTRLPIYAEPQLASLFFVSIGIGVVSGRMLLSRVPAADSTTVLVVSTILCVAGLVVLAVIPDAVGVPLTGLLMGAASGLMMQLLTEWLTGGPAYHHAVHLSRFSAAMAIGLGVGSVASSSFPIADPIRGPIPALAATAMVAACCAAFGKRHLDTAYQRPRAT